MTGLHIDFETRSAVDLRTAGADKYSRDPSTDIWVLRYRFSKDGPKLGWRPGEPLPADLIGHVKAGRLVVAHNVHFELLIWNNILAPRYGAPPLTVEQCDCTMVRAYAAALPGSLDDVGQALKLPVTKDMDGKRLMQRMARPRKTLEDGTHIWWDDADKIQRLTDYCDRDVETEIYADEKLPPLIPYERRLFELDYRINRRGIRLDIPTIERAKVIVDRHRKIQNERLATLTGYAVSSANAVTALRHWMEKRGVFTADLTGPTVTKMLGDDGLPPDVYTALQIREEVGRSSLAKLDAMIESADTDMRARGLLQFTVATTRRWGGRRVQPQNLPRPHWKEDECDAKVEETIRLIHSANPLEALLDAFGSVADPISSALRAMFMAEPGRELIAADYAAIEARVLAWLAGELRRLEVFKSGADIYKITAGDIYGVDPKDVDKSQRQIGKIAELALGYQGGHNAFLRFATAYGVKGITIPFATEIKDKWRGANKNVVRFWYALERAAVSAIENPGKVFAAGDHIRFRFTGRHLLMRLPSGGYLYYPFAKINGDGQVEFFGQDTYTRQWGRQTTYGGKLAENATQAVARDILANGLLLVEDAGYPIVLHVHDEGVAEVANGYGSGKEFAELMATNPDWAKGLPLKAEPWTAERYRK